MTQKCQKLRIGLVIDGTDHFVRPVEAGLRLRHRVDRFCPRFLHLPLVGARINELLLKRQLAEFLRKHDVVFFEWAGSLLITASRLPPVGCIVTRMHSVELATAADQIEWSRIHTTIVLNDSIQRRLEGIAGAALPTVEVVFNGVDLDHYHFRTRFFKYRLGMVCSLLPIKRVYEMILCLHELRQSGLPFTLRIAGSRPKTERRYAWALDSLVEKLSLYDAVHFEGHRGDISDWLSNIDVFVSNSYWEGQQVALLEAMASGCYCLSHFWDGVTDILPGSNIFVTDGDLRTKLERYAAIPEERKQQEMCRTRAIAEEKFDERRMAADIIRVIERAAQS